MLGRNRTAEGNGNGTLRQYREFNNDNLPSLPLAVANMMNLSGLEEFMRELKETLDVSPMLTQAYLVMKYYMKALTNDALGSKAASSLLKTFGTVQPGLDENGNIDSAMTESIIEVHKELVMKTIATKETLQLSLKEASLFLATIQREIMMLLESHYEALVDKFEAREEEEKKVEKHLVDMQTNGRESGVIYDSTTISQKSQKDRVAKAKQEKNNELSYFQKLLKIVGRAFKPAENGILRTESMLAQPA